MLIHYNIRGSEVPLCIWLAVHFVNDDSICATHLGVRGFVTIIARSSFANSILCKPFNFLLIIRHKMSIVTPRIQTSTKMKMTDTVIATVIAASFCLFGRSDTAKDNNTIIV